ncbi:hypothetical protein CLU79DRAFT_502024 [Phycomyces nitens]|nr:hypothetical protein CLU79DRAFT_502024 [Phycomyces nitens]
MFNFESFRRTSSSPSVPTTNDKTNGASDDSGRPGFLQRMASTENVNRTTQSTSTRSNLGNGPKNSASSTFSSILSSSSSIPVPVNSWAMLTLSRLQDTEGEFDDIVDLLLTENRSVLLLPVSRPSHPFIIIDREFIHDHVIVYQNSDMSQGNSLSGIRGIFQKDKFIALGIVPPGRQLMPISNDKQGLDNFHLDTSSIASDQPTYPILASHVQIPIKDKQINVMLIQKPISRTDVIEWDSREINQVEPILSNGLANALADAFVKRYRKNMPRTLDQASATILDFLEDVRSSLLQSGVSSDEIEDRLDEVESYLCNALYECLFPHPGGDESMADEALESRIAALNLLDLNLEHLGVLVSDESEIESIDAVVKTAGIQLQKLNSIMGAKEKMEALVMTHHIIVSKCNSMVCCGERGGY